MTPLDETPLTDAVEEALAAVEIEDRDRGAAAALRALARRIDAWDVIVRWTHEDVEGEKNARPLVPQNDNVAIPTFLKYCEALHLTPASRVKLPKTEEPKGDAIDELRSRRAKKSA